MAWEGCGIAWRGSTGGGGKGFFHGSDSSSFPNSKWVRSGGCGEIEREPRDFNSSSKSMMEGGGEEGGGGRAERSIVL